MNKYLPCGHRVWFHENTETGKEEKPDNGDIGVCTKCANWWRAEDGEMVPYTPTHEEYQEILKRLTRRVAN